MKSVRIFVSSTFLDMHAERDHLNRVVFPELRSRCARRGVDFVGVDLRWGLTLEETEQRGALHACIEEIDRCRPFFVSLLGDRYGWVPPPEQVPEWAMERARHAPGLDASLLEHYWLDDTLETPAYRLRREQQLATDRAARLASFWEDIGISDAGQSITEGEILHGALREGAGRNQAFCYFRQLAVDAPRSLPERLVPVFFEQAAGRRERLARLKQHVLAAQGEQLTVRTYQASYDGLRIDPVREGLQSAAAVALQGMEEFGRMVLDDLWRAIDRHLGTASAVVDLHAEERVNHDRFIARTTRTFIGRKELLDRMLDYVRGPHDEHVLFLTGESGAGKSTLMAECARRCREILPDALVVPLFIGAAPGSTDLAAVVRALCETLRRETAIDEEVSTVADKLHTQLQTFLARSAAQRTVILLIDALNQLDPANHSHALNWLPFYVPRGARLIVSTLAGDCLDAIRRRVPAECQLDVPSLPRLERHALVRDQLALRSKRLTDAQLARLIDDGTRRDAGLPLYLLVAVEELSLCRDRETVDRRLDEFPSTVGDLFEQVLQRLEEDHTRTLTQRTLRRIGVSRSGLLESEIIDLLADTDIDVPQLRWSQLYRALEFYLRPLDETNRTGLVDFYHDQLRFAVYRRYLGMDSPNAAASRACRDAHEELAAYFRSSAIDESGHRRWRRDRAHSVSEAPYHQVNAGRAPDARALMLDFEWLQTKLEALGPPAVLADFALIRDDPTLDAVASAVQRSASTLARDNGQLAGQLLGRLLASPDPDIQTLLAQASRWSDRPWLRPITASLAPLDRPRSESFIGVSTVAISSDLRHAITCSEEGPVSVWDLQTEQRIRTLGPYSVVRCASAATRDGTCVLTGSADGSISVWTPLEGEGELRRLGGHTGPITALAITPDGRLALSASQDQALKLWDVRLGVELPRFAGQLLTATRLAVSPDGRRALSASADGLVRFWNVDSGSHVRAPFDHGAPIQALAISADGSRAVFASDQTLHVFRIDDGDHKELAGHHGVIRTIAPTSGALVITGSDDINLRVWDVEQCREVGILREHWWSITAAAVSSDGLHAVSAARDEKLRVWDLQSYREQQVLNAPTSWINSVSTTPDGRYVLTASRDKSIKVWDAASGALVRAFAGHTEWANAVAVTPDGNRALSGGDDNVVRVWSFPDGEPLTTLAGYGNGVSALAISPDGHTLMTGCWDQTLKVWDLETCTLVRDLTGHFNEERPGWIRAVAIAPDGQRAVSAAQDHTLKLWDLGDGRELRTLTGHAGWVMGAAILPDGRRVVSSSADLTLKVWDIDTGATLATMTGHHGFVTSVALVPGGRFAISTSEDATLRVWDLVSSQEVMSFTGDGELRSCAVTPDGVTIVVGEDSGRLHFLRRS